MIHVSHLDFNKTGPTQRQKQLGEARSCIGRQKDNYKENDLPGSSSEHTPAKKARGRPKSVTPPSKSSRDGQKNVDLHAQLERRELRLASSNHELKLTKRREKRLRAAVKASKREKLQMRVDLKRAEHENSKLKRRTAAVLAQSQQLSKLKDAQLAKLVQRLEEAHHDLRKSEEFVFEQHRQLLELRRIVRNLQVVRQRMNILQKRIREQRTNSALLTRMKIKQTYAPKFRALARLLVDSGCKMGKVGHAIRDVAKVFGIQLKHRMSRKVVSMSIHEGSVMARIHQGFTMKSTDSTLIKPHLNPCQ